MCANALNRVCIKMKHTFKLYFDSLKIQNTACHEAGLGFFGMDDSFRLFVPR